MRTLRNAGAGFIGAVGGLLIFAVFLFVIVGGNAYRKDCLTSTGAISQSWTFTWDTPVPFLFRPSNSACVIHVGDRVLLNALGVDTYPPTTPNMIASRAAGSSPTKAYWNDLDVTLAALEHVPSTADLTAHLAALAAARNQVASLHPPSAAAAANAQLVQDLSKLLATGQTVRHALLTGQESKAQAADNQGKVETANLKQTLTRLNQIRLAQ